MLLRVYTSVWAYKNKLCKKSIFDRQSPLKIIKIFNIFNQDKKSLWVGHALFHLRYNLSSKTRNLLLKTHILRRLGHIVFWKWKITRWTTSWFTTKVQVSQGVDLTNTRVPNLELLTFSFIWRGEWIVLRYAYIYIYCLGYLIGLSYRTDSSEWWKGNTR